MPAAEAPRYPYSATEPRILYATARGLAEAPSRDLVPAPASQVPNASVLSADDGRILAAVNVAGIAIIEPAPGGGTFKVVNAPGGELFAGRTTGGAWPRAGGFLVQLYRDPFAAGATETGRRGDISLLSVNAAGELGRTVAAGGDDPLSTAAAEGFELFALFPDSKGGWLAELRKDEADRASLRYLWLQPPGVAGPGDRELRRAAFETALAPRPLAWLTGDAGTRLETAIAALGGGAVLARLRGADGADAWYLSGGRIEEARTLSVWVEANGTLVALEADGRAAVVRGEGPAAMVALAAPSPGATFTAIATVGNLAAAAWEAGNFPELRAAGLVAFSLPER